jgi:hypothetical protein
LNNPDVAQGLLDDAKSFAAEASAASTEAQDAKNESITSQVQFNGALKSL